MNGRLLPASSMLLALLGAAPAPAPRGPVPERAAAVTHSGVPAPGPAAPALPPVKELRLDSLAGLELVNVTGEVAVYRGRRAVRLVDLSSKHDPGKEAGGHAMAIVAGSDFGSGTIEAEVAGRPRAGASAEARGFIGIAFHVKDRGSRFECFYLRPTNARVDDQLRRNHSTQYISFPGFPWERLRRESPGVYESYVDLEPGAWTRIRVVGARARLYVHGSDQPALIVDDLKQGEARAQVALWIGEDTDGWFSNLVIR
jgi:hypothetical protein